MHPSLVSLRRARLGQAGQGHIPVRQAVLSGSAAQLAQLHQTGLEQWLSHCLVDGFHHQMGLQIQVLKAELQVQAACWLCYNLQLRLGSGLRLHAAAGPFPTRSELQYT